VFSLAEQHSAYEHCHRIRPRAGDFREGFVDGGGSSRLDELKLDPKRSCGDFRCFQHLLFCALAEGTWLPEDPQPD
jgi:hypothetical protein